MKGDICYTMRFRLQAEEFGSAPYSQKTRQVLKT